MHEYSIVGAMIARVEAEASQRNATRVRLVHVRIGELSGVEPELLASAYKVFRESTMCESAELLIEQVAARWVCGACGGIVCGGILRCANCGGLPHLITGDEILLQRIEMEVE